MAAGPHCVLDVDGRTVQCLLQEKFLSEDAFQFSPELLRHLAPDHWSDDYYFSFGPSNYHYPVNEMILSIQRMVISRYLDPGVLQSVQEIERHAESGETLLSMSDIFDSLTSSIWSDLLPSKRARKGRVELSVVRRNLQREHFKQLSTLVLGQSSGSGFYDLIFYVSSQPTPPDARSLARLHLKRIDSGIQQALDADRIKADVSRAHLEELRDQIQKVLEASLEAGSP